MARVYADVNALSGPKWYDYGPYSPSFTSPVAPVPITVASTDHMEIQWNEPSRYEIIRRIGGGKYSEV